MSEIGRLLFTRRSGESFVVGDGTQVIVHTVDGKRTYQVGIISPDGTKSYRSVMAREPFWPVPEVKVELSPDQDRNRSIRIMVLAPKSIRILRSELIARGKETTAEPV
jgi:sRNA-binding carbon storage regulator CsrA